MHAPNKFVELIDKKKTKEIMSVKKSAYVIQVSLDLHNFDFDFLHLVSYIRCIFFANRLQHSRSCCV